MRITGGTGRGRRLKVPAGEKVRPTSDKVKQALFNILGDRVPGSTFLDLFAGAGGVGIEALSRGADRVVFVDGDRESLDVVKHNIEQAGFAERAEAVLAKAETFPQEALRALRHRVPRSALYHGDAAAAAADCRFRSP